MHTQQEYIRSIVSQVDVKRLKGHVRNIEGLRHGRENYEALEKKAGYIENTLRALNLETENQYFDFHGKTYRNILATKWGTDKDTDWVLLGAHYDAASGSPGADDNGSGVASMLESAYILSNCALERTVQFVAFTLEEPQPQTIHFLIGSDHFARTSRKMKRRYEAVYILESVGYTDDAEGSQFVPLLVRLPVPRTGNFLGIVANSRSKTIMEAFHSAAGEYVPNLVTVPYKVPFSGRIIPETRFSDHASFWNQGYPALMLTDTAMFRNPFYHTSRDRYETLNFDFLTNVTKAVVSAILVIGNVR
jgi:Zn-dependent M28 family amino/carboxypeptidase